MVEQEDPYQRLPAATADIDLYAYMRELTSDYYLLGCYSTNTDARKRVRALDVKVRRPGIGVAARSAYSVPSPPADRAPRK